MRESIGWACVYVEQVVPLSFVDGATRELYVSAVGVCHSVLKVFDLPLPAGLASPKVSPVRVDHRTIHLGRSAAHNSCGREDLVLWRPKNERVGGSKLCPVV